MTRESAKAIGLTVTRENQAYRRAMDMLPVGAKGVKIAKRKKGVHAHYINDIGLEMQIFSPFEPRKLIVK